MSNLYSISKMAKRVGVSISTFRRWDDSGQLVAKRHASGHRFYDESDVRSVLHIQTNDLRTLYIAHKDRLVRFGFDLIEHTAKMNGCEIVVVNQQSLSPQQEMIEDLLAIVHTFSCRLYGLRSYKKKIKEVCLEGSSRTQD